MLSLFFVSLLALTSAAAAAIAAAVPTPVNQKNSIRLRSRQLLATNAAVDVPFYVQEDSTGNLVAVIQYGDSNQEETKIIVPCGSSKQATETTFAKSVTSESTITTGPSVVVCQDLGDGKYQLRLPFRFERDAQGVIVGVDFDDGGSTVPFQTILNPDGSVMGIITTDNENLTIPFYQSIDPDDGSIAGVVYVPAAGTNNDKTENETRSGSGSVAGIVLTAVGLLVVVVVVLGLLFGVLHSFWCGLGCGAMCGRQQHRRCKHGENGGLKAMSTTTSKSGSDNHNDDEQDTQTLASDTDNDDGDDKDDKLNE